MHPATRKSEVNWFRKINRRIEYRYLRSHASRETWLAEISLSSVSDDPAEFRIRQRGVTRQVCNVEN